MPARLVAGVTSPAVCQNAYCGRTSPGDGPTCRWHIRNCGTKERPNHVTLCNACKINFDQGKYCPFCYQIYRERDPDQFDKKQWFCCASRHCHRWVHQDCDTWRPVSNSSAEGLQPASQGYKCPACRELNEPDNDTQPLQQSPTTFRQRVSKRRLSGTSSSTCSPAKALSTAGGTAAAAAIDLNADPHDADVTAAAELLSGAHLKLSGGSPRRASSTSPPAVLSAKVRRLSSSAPPSKKPKLHCAATATATATAAGAEEGGDTRRSAIARLFSGALSALLTAPTTPSAVSTAPLCGVASVPVPSTAVCASGAAVPAAGALLVPPFAAPSVGTPLFHSVAHPLPTAPAALSLPVGTAPCADTVSSDITMQLSHSTHAAQVEVEVRQASPGAFLDVSPAMVDVPVAFCEKLEMVSRRAFLPADSARMACATADLASTIAVAVQQKELIELQECVDNEQHAATLKGSFSGQRKGNLPSPSAGRRGGRQRGASGPKALQRDSQSEKVVTRKASEMARGSATGKAVPTTCTPADAPAAASTISRVPASATLPTAVSVQPSSFESLLQTAVTSALHEECHPDQQDAAACAAVGTVVAEQTSPADRLAFKPPAIVIEEGPESSPSSSAISTPQSSLSGGLAPPLLSEDSGHADDGATVTPPSEGAFSPRMGTEARCLVDLSMLQVSSLRRYHRTYVCQQALCSCEDDLKSSVSQHFASLVVREEDILHSLLSAMTRHRAKSAPRQHASPLTLQTRTTRQKRTSRMSTGETAQRSLHREPKRGGLRRLMGAEKASAERNNRPVSSRLRAKVEGKWAKRQLAYHVEGSV